MKKKIIEALKLKFEGVSDAIIERMAEKLAKTVTNEDGIQPAVDAVTFQSFLESYGDSRASEASQTAIKNYEGKYSLKDGKPVKQEPKQEPAPAQTNGTTDVPAWAQALIDANKVLSDKLTALEGKNTANKRLELLKAALKDIPETISKSQLKQFERMSFADDNDFEKWIEEVKTDTSAIAEAMKTSGAGVGGTKGSTPGAGGEPSKEDIDEIVSMLSV